MQREEVKAFKNELRNYTYYCSRIATLNNSIEFIYDRLGGVRGIDPSKEPTHVMPNKDLEYKLRDDIEKLEAKKKRVERQKQFVDEVLAQIENEFVDAIKKVYIEGMRMDKVCIEYNFSASGMGYRIDKAIERALNEV